MTEQFEQHSEPASVNSSNRPNWLENDVLHPLWNSAVVRSANAVRTLVNPVAGLVGEHLSPMENQPVVAEHGLEGGLQTVSAAAGGLIPYLVAGRAMNGLLAKTSEKLALSGNLGQLATSERFANIAGAAAFDGLRDPSSGETRLGNALSGASTFYVFGVGNQMAGELSSNFHKAIARVATGFAAGDTGNLVSNLVSRHEVGSGYLDAGVSGAVLNSLFPLAQRGIGTAVDTVSMNAGRPIPAARFVEKAGLAGQVDGMAEAVKAAPYAKVRFGSTAAENGNVIEVPSDVTPQMQADILRTKLHNLAMTRGPVHRGGTFSNGDIEEARQTGRVGIEPFNQNQLFSNGYDVKLGTRFMKQPAGEVLDFSKQTPKEILRDWTKRGLEQEYPNGIVLAPGETTLGFTQERISLPRMPKRNADGSMQDWQGRPPVLADINQKSTLARLEIRNHAAAPVLNNDGTDHRVVFEIKNDGPSPVKLMPGMPMGSLVFRELHSHPLPEINSNKVTGQTTLTGLQTPSESNGAPGNLTTVTSPSRFKLTLLPMDDLSKFNKVDHATVAQPTPIVPLDYSKLSPLDRLRYDPNSQDAYLEALSH